MRSALVPDAMPTILLARHGQASYGADDYDALSDQGHEQVGLLDAELQRQGLTVGYVAAGTMRRQQETAAPIAATAGVPLATDARLDEFDADDVLRAYSPSDARLGGTATLSSAQFQEVLDQALRRWVAVGADATTTETWVGFADRALESLADAGDVLGQGATGVLATSGGVIAAACVRLLGLPDSAFPAFNRVVVNAGLTKIAAGRRGLTLVSFNEHAHVQSAGRSLVTYR